MPAHLLPGATMRVLCTGDLHIGRRASRIPAQLDIGNFTNASAWERIVDTAIQQRADIIAISGDLIDRANRFFEAFGPVERGLRKLADAGIETYAVAGNHDFDVLPRLIDSLAAPGFHLLGRGGEWERRTVVRTGEPLLHIDGWSFPQEHVRASALTSYRPPAPDQVPVLGIVHAELDQPQSRYGPVALQELLHQPASLWLLGHIHVPATHQSPSSPVVLNPGSPQAMDPGELGWRGAWLAEIEPGREVRLSRVPISCVEYRRVVVDLTDLKEFDELEPRIATAIRDALADVSNRGENRLECLCCRVVLTGRTPLHRHLHGVLNDIQQDLMPTFGRITGVIEKIEYATRPARDLDELARGTDLPAELARLVRALENDDDPVEYRALILETQQKLRDVHGHRSYLDVADEQPLNAADVRRHLRDQGWLLLDTLLAQKESV